MILIYVTNPNKQEAEKVINHLIDKKLIACGNIFPITSCYLWKGEKENSNEFVCLLKTKNENWEVVKKEIKKIHSYDIPCIIKINVEANKEYDDWVGDEVE